MNSSIDSLPYIDKEYDDPSIQSEVLKMVQEEMEQTEPPKHKTKAIALFANNPMLRQEYERVKFGHPLPAFDTTRYQLPAPATDSADDWHKAVQNADSQLTHQHVRLLNLELLQQFGSNAWLLSLKQQEQLLKSIENATQRYRQEGMQINRERKQMQMAVGEQLREMEARWMDGVQKCIDIQTSTSS